MTPRPPRTPAPKTFGAGSVLPLVALLIAGTTIALASLSSLGVFRPSTAASAIEQSLPPTPVELAAALARVGLTPESLTAAGVQSAGAVQVVTDARSHLDIRRFAGLTAADDAWKAASANAERLGKLVRAGQGTNDDVTALRQAETALRAAETARQTQLGDLRDAATANLTRDQTQALTRIESNSGAGLDTSYLINDRSQADWVALRDALANLRISQKIGEDPDANCSRLVTQTNAETEVAAAKSHINTRLPQVTAAFEQELEG